MIAHADHSEGAEVVEVDNLQQKYMQTLQNPWPDMTKMAQFIQDTLINYDKSSIVNYNIRNEPLCLEKVIQKMESPHKPDQKD